MPPVNGDPSPQKEDGRGWSRGDKIALGILIATIVGVLVTLNQTSGGGKGSSTKSTPVANRSQAAPPTSPSTSPTRPLFLDKTAPISSSPGSSTTFGAGLATIAGTPFYQSVRMLDGYFWNNDQ